MKNFLLHAVLSICKNFNCFLYVLQKNLDHKNFLPSYSRLFSQLTLVTGSDSDEDLSAVTLQKHVQKEALDIITCSKVTEVLVQDTKFIQYNMILNKHKLRHNKTPMHSDSGTSKDNLLCYSELIIPSHLIHTYINGK